MINKSDLQTAVIHYVTQSKVSAEISHFLQIIRCPLKVNHHKRLIDSYLCCGMVVLPCVKAGLA